jgi:uncharacterized protein (DUF3084 family)
MKKFVGTLICLALMIQNSFCDQKTNENLEQIVANQAKQLEGQSNQLKFQEHLLEHQSKQLKQQENLLEHQSKQLEDITKLLETHARSIAVLEQVIYFLINLL